MKKVSFLLAVTGILLCCSSCSKKSNPAPVAAAQTIIATVNDTAIVYSFNPTASFSATVNGNVINFRAYQPGTSNSIYIFLNNFVVGTNTLSKTTSNDIELFDGAENFYDANIHPGSGSIVVTKFDSINKVITGTFNARVYSHADSTSYIDISNGGFNIQYQ